MLLLPNLFFLCGTASSILSQVKAKYPLPPWSKPPLKIAISFPSPTNCKTLTPSQSHLPSPVNLGILLLLLTPNVILDLSELSKVPTPPITSLKSSTTFTDGSKHPNRTAPAFLMDNQMHAAYIHHNSVYFHNISSNSAMSWSTHSPSASSFLSQLPHNFWFCSLHHCHFWFYSAHPLADQIIILLRCISSLQKSVSSEHRGTSVCWETWLSTKSPFKLLTS